MLRIEKGEDESSAVIIGMMQRPSPFPSGERRPFRRPAR
jgi:hypothetical protein